MMIFCFCIFRILKRLVNGILLKFVFSEKATKFDKIFTINSTLTTYCQIDGESLVNFCGLLRKHELYQNSTVRKNCSSIALYLYQNWKLYYILWFHYLDFMIFPKVVRNVAAQQLYSRGKWCHLVNLDFN